MKFEFSAGAVVFKQRDNKIEYLLLCHPSRSKTRPHDIWDFPKGLFERGERALEVAQREVAEETGLSDLKFLEGFKEKDDFFFRWQGEFVKKSVTYFLAEARKQGSRPATTSQMLAGRGFYLLAKAKEGEVELSHEHTDFAWLPFEEALERLTSKGSKEILRKVDKFLQRSGQVLKRKEGNPQ